MDTKVILYIIVILIIIVVYIMVRNINIVNNKNNNTKAVNGNIGEKNMDQGKYVRISPVQMMNETKEMDKNEYVILDVRTKPEYDEVRIPGAVLLPLSDIETDAESVLPNKDMKIYVYCRSGSRSRQAAYLLLDMGYKNVYDFGGIIDYPYETEKGAK